MPYTARDLQDRLSALATPADALHLSRFFKTGKGDYGEGDIFRGIRVPILRKVAGEMEDTPLKELERLLRSEFHEDRALAVIMLVYAFKSGSASMRDNIFKLYMRNTRHVNNWDLVDISCPQIVGGHLFDKDRSVLDKLAKSSLLWERRIAIVSTLHFIRDRQFADTLRISALLLDDGHDLMHKAVGWMLREVGKRDLSAEEGFLKSHATRMPRTALRYAIERFPERERLAYLKMK